jgi:hypothetical protein
MVYRVALVRFTKENCGQIYPKMIFFEQNFESQLRPKVLTGNVAISLLAQNWWYFYWVIRCFKSELRSQNLKFWVFRVPIIYILTQNGELKVLFNKFTDEQNSKHFCLVVLGLEGGLRR